MPKRIVFVGLTLLSFAVVAILAWTLSVRNSPSIPSSSAPRGEPPASCPALQRGLAFLQARYNPTLGLIAESPVVAPHKYWLTNDNALAAYALSQLGNSDQAATITKSLQRYGHVSNGLIEVVWGVPVSWPPRIARPVLISQTGLDEIWQEFHDGDGRFDDWSEYANLAFLAALNENALGHSEQARTIFTQAMQKFDGSGFRDKAYTDHYETYKLALALYVGSTIHAPMPNSTSQLLSILLSMQSSDGGFTSLYRDRQTPLGDANTETTALALLALSVYGCVP